MEIEMKKLVDLPSRTGRELQRYHMGHRQVVGCIPYRCIDNERSSCVHEALEVLMVSSQKCDTMMFPKGGWEEDESTMEAAALRESLEEAGVFGTIQSQLGKWIYKSKNQDILHDGYMFPLLVEEELDYWPEKKFRQRKWVKVQEANKLCPHVWMKEALELLVQRLAKEKSNALEASTPCFEESVSSSSSFFQAPFDMVKGEVSCHQNVATLSNLVQGEVYPHQSFKAHPIEVESRLNSFRSLKVQVDLMDIRVNIIGQLNVTNRFAWSQVFLENVLLDFYCHRSEGIYASYELNKAAWDTQIYAAWKESIFRNFQCTQRTPQARRISSNCMVELMLEEQELQSLYLLVLVASVVTAFVVYLYLQLFFYTPL